MAPAEAVRPDKDMQQCIQACLECHRVCLETVTYCLRKGGKHAEASHIRLLMDCAEICQTSANFLLRGSELHTRTCFACAEVCQRCADSCAAMGEDSMMKACEDMCRRCEESCRKMDGGLMPQVPNPEAAQRAADLPA
ncbi:four-helix bundle copper-binding protein [Pyxidicoccus fallax]|uniref:Four-helix bundle copper-binding protein n=1 Tax=Pyxidicoccus fallax TaxID=394095 RepID=A0A848LDY5_9BACT|nr:four-helix bundle copper-binding protein [Pyxidicoccus fallax]NMO16656.1 four-helix bundle copper-binding protein [Pyxidicoccus fallax]NPC85844.1 four-helix bundle copper-binding protein [Pyxidicoccus fallax]